MEIYLIRHTTPLVAKGTCYGQSDLDLHAGWLEEAAVIRAHLPTRFGSVHSSPLRRCARLAGHLFPDQDVRLHPDLMEIHCGVWEMRHWDELPRTELDPWMEDFVSLRIPGGESYMDLSGRVNRCYRGIRDAAMQAPIAIVSHGGPIRSILSELTGTPLIDSFKVFALHYGCVVRLSDRTGVWQYEILSNPAPAEKEQHKPKKR